MSLNGMASTSHPLASLAAVECLRRGGNAVDAAVTASAVLCVVEPQSTGIGGDCFAIVATPDGALHGLNGSGRAAAGVTLDWFLERGLGEVHHDSVHAVTVPGAVAAWARLLADHGTWDLGRCLEAAIGHAEEGFPVAPRIAASWAHEEARLSRDEGARLNYLLDGRAPKVGEVFRMPALARTLRLISERGPAGFYEGEVAADIVATLAAKGSFLTLDDLAAMEPTAVTPVVTGYRDIEVAELPPNGQGITALILLNILKRFELKGLDPHGPERHHLHLEATRLAYACRDAFIADPAHMRVSVDMLVSDGYGAQLADRIDPNRRLADVTPERVPEADTVYLSVVDRDRLAVSFINSTYDSFGVGISTAKSGVVLQNRGACFVTTPGHPNAIGPSKRPMHTIIPGFALRKGRPFMPFGVMGGAYQACGHAFVISNMIDFGMDPQEAIDASRVFPSEGWSAVDVENGLPAATVQGLRARGHEVRQSPAPIGGGQAIRIDWDKGVLVAGSDPRKDGAAIGY
jgi:gamma-glutamyltranspeptidase/glutathione hydrolase